MSRPAIKGPKNSSLDELTSVLREHLPELRERYSVRSLGVFGSYVRGEQHKRSDLDILVDIDDPSLTLFQFVELRDYLSEILGKRVDLVEKQALKPTIGKHVLEEVVFL